METSETDIYPMKEQQMPAGTRVSASTNTCLPQNTLPGSPSMKSLTGMAGVSTPQNWYPHWYPRRPSVDRRFSVLYVPDPHSAAPNRGKATDLSWVMRDIPLTVYKTITHLTGHVYKTYENRNTSMVRVLINEWVRFPSYLYPYCMSTSVVQLWLLLRMEHYDKGQAFKVTYMTWETFRDIILDPRTKSEGWNGLVSLDCIIGGIDYSIDYR